MTAAEKLTPFRERVDVALNIIVRTAKVNRRRSLQGAIDATGCAFHMGCEVVEDTPKGGVDEVEVVFFRPDLSDRKGFITDDDLEKEFERRGLKPADLASVAAVNEAYPGFADEKPHGTHWKDSKGKWCCATFLRWRGVRSLFAYRRSHRWDDSWWFAGIRK